MNRNNTDIYNPVNRYADFELRLAAPAQRESMLLHYLFTSNQKKPLIRRNQCLMAIGLHRS